MRLDYRDGGAELVVEDRGAAGPGDLSASGGGYGLAGLSERAALAGGRLEAGPTGGGLRLRLWLQAS